MARLWGGAETPFIRDVLRCQQVTINCIPAAYGGRVQWTAWLWTDRVRKPSVGPSGGRSQWTASGCVPLASRSFTQWEAPVGDQREEGKKEGRKEGREEGREEGWLEVLFPCQVSRADRAPLLPAQPLSLQLITCFPGSRCASSHCPQCHTPTARTLHPRLTRTPSLAGPKQRTPGPAASDPPFAVSP